VVLGTLLGVVLSMVSVVVSFFLGKFLVEEDKSRMADYFRKKMRVYRRWNILVAKAHRKKPRPSSPKPSLSTDSTWTNSRSSSGSP